MRMETEARAGSVSDGVGGSVADSSGSCKQKLLGVFVLAQFAAVFVSNLGGFLKPLPDATTGVLPPPPEKPLDYVRFAADRYCEATGQPQGWGMFDAGSMRNSVSLKVVFVDGKGNTHERRGIAGTTESAPRHTWPAALSRRFVYEAAFLGRELVHTPPVHHRDDNQFHDDCKDEIRINNAAYASLMKGMVQQKRDVYPDYVPAREVVLFVEWLPTLTPNQPGQVAMYDSRVVARMVLNQTSDALPVEAFSRYVNGERTYTRFQSPGP